MGSEKWELLHTRQTTRVVRSKEDCTAPGKERRSGKMISKAWKIVAALPILAALAFLSFDVPFKV